MRRTLLSLALVAACMPPAAKAAWRLDYDLGMGYQYSDNINLSQTDPISENVLIPSINFSLSETGSVLRADIAGSLEYYNYLGGEFANELRTNLDADVDWTIMPERLNWVVSDHLGMEPVNLRAADTPGNMQRTNVFTTGPTLRFNLAPTLRGRTDLRYVDSYAENSRDFDSSRISAAFRAEWERSTTQQFSAGVEVQDVDFDYDNLAEDYKRRSAFVGYTHRLTDLNLNVIAGYAWLDFTRGHEASAPFVRTSLYWTITPNNRIRVAGAWEYSDAATFLAEGAGGIDEEEPGRVAIGGAMVSPDVYRERRLEASYVHESARLVATASAFTGRFRYESTLSVYTEDRDERGGFLDVGYRARPLLTFGALLNATRRHYVDSDERDTTKMYGLYVSHDLSRHWNWRADVRRLERESATGTTPTYNENQVFLRLTYRR